MPTLYQALLNQHSRLLSPARQAEQMTQQLQSFFEEVVLENALPALIVESLPSRPIRSWREIERVRSLLQTARFPFFLTTADDELHSQFNRGLGVTAHQNLIALEYQPSADQDERFLIVSDAHFSAVLASITLPTSESQFDNHSVVYSFDPNVVYTALEHLQTRFAADYSEHFAHLAKAIQQSVPKAISLRMTLTVTNKLADLWREQAGREIAMNRVGTAIRQSLELEQVLQTTVNEVGAALGERLCALLVEAEDDQSLSVQYFRNEIQDEERQAVSDEMEIYRRRLRSFPQPYIHDGYGLNHSAATSRTDRPCVVVPLSFLDEFVGVLYVQSENPARIWRDGDLLLLQTVADQVSIAVKHARLYLRSQQEALKDPLTGIFNRRFLETQLEREFKKATRKEMDLSLIVVDLDRFKSINDTYGHATGDAVLKSTVAVLQSGLRAFDTLARYGGEEFVIILPQTDLNEAYTVAERLRQTIEVQEIPDVRKITASFGVAAFPLHADNPLELFKIADEALLNAKATGRNRVCLPNLSDAATVS